MKGNRISRFFVRLILVFWALVVIVPICFIVLQSLKTNQEFFQGVWALPKTPMWSNYVKAWNDLGIGKAFLNTVYVVGLSMVIGLFFSTVCAYSLTRLKWKGKKLILGIIMLSLFLPGINALLPQYVLMRSLHLTNSLNGLIILYSVGCNAFEIMVLSGFMQSIPKEMEESAYIDGASIFRTYWRIIMPLAVPGIITVGIFRFISLYNDFISPFVYLTDQKKWTIGVAMYQANQLMQYQSNWTALCAGVIITVVPTLLFYILFQKRVVEGATLGAVKG